MPAMTNSFENDIINYFLRNQVVTQPTTVYLALSTATPAEDGTGFTEPVDAGYSRQAITFAAPSSGSTSSSNTITFGPAVSSWGTITNIGIFFQSSGGDLKLYKSTSSRSVGAGDSIGWSIGDLIASFD